MGTNDNGYSINGKAITYNEDLGKAPEYSYSFFTNTDSKRQLTFGSTVSSGWWMVYIHADDINK